MFWQHHTYFDRVHPYTGTERHSFYLDLLTADPTILNECSQLNSVTRYLLLLGANMCPLTHDEDLLNMFLKCSFMYIYNCLCLDKSAWLWHVPYLTQTHTSHILAHAYTHITHSRTRVHTHHTYSHTYQHEYECMYVLVRVYVCTRTSVCMYSYTRCALYSDCWTLNVSDIVSYPWAVNYLHFPSVLLFVCFVP